LPVGRSASIDLNRSLFKLEAPVSVRGDSTNLEVVDDFLYELDEAEVLDDDSAELDDEWPPDANADDDKVEGESE